MTQDYLVLDGVYYWFLKEGSKAYKIIGEFEDRSRDGEDLVLLRKHYPKEPRDSWSIYERDPKGEGPEDDLE